MRGFLCDEADQLVHAVVLWEKQQESVVLCLALLQQVFFLHQLLQSYILPIKQLVDVGGGVQVKLPEHGSCCKWRHVPGQRGLAAVGVSQLMSHKWINQTTTKTFNRIVQNTWPLSANQHLTGLYSELQEHPDGMFLFPDGKSQLHSHWPLEGAIHFYVIWDMFPCV